MKNRIIFWALVVIFAALFCWFIQSDYDPLNSIGEEVFTDSEKRECVRLGGVTIGNISRNVCVATIKVGGSYGK